MLDVATSVVEVDAVLWSAEPPLDPDEASPSPGEGSLHAAQAINDAKTDQPHRTVEG